MGEKGEEEKEEEDSREILQSLNESFMSLVSRMFVEGNNRLGTAPSRLTNSSAVGQLKSAPVPLANGLR